MRRLNITSCRVTYREGIMSGFSFFTGGETACSWVTAFRMKNTWKESRSVHVESVHGSKVRGTVSSKAMGRAPAGVLGAHCLPGRVYWMRGGDGEALCGEMLRWWNAVGGATASQQPGLSIHSGRQCEPGSSRLTLCISDFLLSNIMGKMKWTILCKNIMEYHMTLGFHFLPEVTKLEA